MKLHLLLVASTTSVTAAEKEKEQKRVRTADKGSTAALRDGLNFSCLCAKQTTVTILQNV